MGLQVRVRHALGERLVDLADRPVERPLVVGRSREADLKIPSVTVAVEHCVLFVHNRQWVIQDNSGGATYVNGTIIQAPTPLCVGDVVVLGTDASPASIEIDPAGVAQGRSGHPAETHDPVPVTRALPAVAAHVAAHVAARAPYSAAQAMPAYDTAHASAAAPPAQDPWGNPSAGQDDPFAGWQPAAATETSGSAIRRRRRKTSQAPMFIGIGIAAVIVIGTLVFAVLHGASDKKTVTIEVDKQSKPKSDNMFDIGPDGSVGGMPAGRQPQAAHRKNSPDSAAPAEVPTPAAPAHEPAPAPAPPPAAPADSTPTPAAAPAADPAPSPASAAEAPPVDEKAWSDVQSAFDGPNQGIFILKSEDYRRQHPNSGAKQLDTMVETALDRIWWGRITDLCEKQAGINSDLKKKDKDIREETSSAFKATLMGERKELEAKLAEVQMHLNGDMGYTSSETPKIEDKELMQKLAAERDKDKYASWKQSTLKYVRTHHGNMPWDG